MNLHRSSALLTSAAFLLAIAVPAQELSPELRDRRAMVTVAQLLEEDHLTEQQLNDAISRKALQTYFGEDVTLALSTGSVSQMTPLAERRRRAAERQAQAVAEIEADPQLARLIERFDGELDRNSIVPLDS